MTISDLMQDNVHSRRRTLTLLGMRLPWPFPIVYALSSSSAMVLGYPLYGSNPPRYIKLLGRLFRRISDAKYWLLYRLHPRHRYHMIDTGLGYGYHERDDQLLYGAMACLIGYVEDCEASGCHDPGDEARAILQWWRVERPANQAQYDKWLHELYGNGRRKMSFKPVEGMPQLQEVVLPEMDMDDQHKQQAMWDLEEKMRKDEADYLHRLVDIRLSMWT